MKKTMYAIATALFALALALTPTFAGDLATDITKEELVGPGSIGVNTQKDTLMSFGASIRMIPTSESNWDFGLSEQVDAFLVPFGNAVSENFFKDHANEAGWVNNGYIRNEDKLFFNAIPKDRAWSFFAALEFDKPLDTDSVDSRGGRSNDDSNFGLERLHATMALARGMRFHAGWDIWHLDVIEGAGLAYGDDNPGFWLTGDYDTISWNVGYFKLVENDFTSGPNLLDDDSDDDRDLYAAHLTWKPSEVNKFKLFYALDVIREVQAGDLLSALTSGAAGITGGTPETDSHHIGGYWIGTFGELEVFGEAVYQFGNAEDAGLAYDDYDINAYALSFDLSYDFKEAAGFSLKPHIGIMYTSGDDDGTDDELGGYNGVENAQRFSQRWGGENTIVGDTNMVFGSLLYGYLPELYGNGTPIFTGGIENFAGFGGGRGDNPGLMMLSFGVTTAPKQYIIYRTNFNSFWWNQDFYVTNMVDPLLGATEVEGDYVGLEWDNELIFALSKHTNIKAQASFFFPGDGIENVTEALGATSDDTASRLAIEFFWGF